MTHSDYFQVIEERINQMLGQGQFPSTSSELNDVAVDLYTDFAADAGIPDVYDIELCIASILFKARSSEAPGTKT